MTSELFEGAATSIEELRVLFPAFHFEDVGDGYVKGEFDCVEVCGYGPGTVHSRLLAFLAAGMGEESSAFLIKGVPNVVYAGKSIATVSMVRIDDGKGDKLIATFADTERAERARARIAWALLRMRDWGEVLESDQRSKSAAIDAVTYVTQMAPMRERLRAVYDSFDIDEPNRVWGMPRGYCISLQEIPLK